MIKDFAKILRNLSDDIVGVATLEGVVEWSIENIIEQPIEGLLYDLNRDMATNYTRLAENDQRAINDIAMAKILTWLLKERKEGTEMTTEQRAEKYAMTYSRGLQKTAFRAFGEGYSEGVADQRNIDIDFFKTWLFENAPHSVWEAFVDGHIMEDEK